MTAFLLQYQTILRTVWQKESRVEKVMMTLVQTTVLQKSSDIAQTFSQAELNALFRDTCQNLGRTSEITHEIQKFTGTWHVFLLVQKPRGRICMLFSTIDPFVYCSDSPGLMKHNTAIRLRITPISYLACCTLTYINSLNNF